MTSARLPRGALGVRLRAAHLTRRPRAAPAPQKSWSRLLLASLPVRTSRSRRFWNLPRACSHRLSRQCAAPPPPRVFAEAPGAPPTPWFNLRLRSMLRAPGQAPPTARITLVHPRLHEPPAAARGPVLLPARLLGSVLDRAAVPALSSPPRPSPARGLCPPGARDCVTRLSHRNTDRSAPCVLRKCEDPYTAAALCRARAENPLSPRPGSPGCLQTGRGKMGALLFRFRRAQSGDKRTGPCFKANEGTRATGRGLRPRGLSVGPGRRTRQPRPCRWAQTPTCLAVRTPLRPREVGVAVSVPRWQEPGQGRPVPLSHGVLPRQVRAGDVTAFEMEVSGGRKCFPEVARDRMKNVYLQ